LNSILAGQNKEVIKTKYFSCKLHSHLDACLIAPFEFARRADRKQGGETTLHKAIGSGKFAAI
jgi:hypothetical protein